MSNYLATIRFTGNILTNVPDIQSSITGSVTAYGGSVDSVYLQGNDLIVSLSLPPAPSNTALQNLVDTIASDMVGKYAVNFGATYTQQMMI